MKANFYAEQSMVLVQDFPKWSMSKLMVRIRIFYFDRVYVKLIYFIEPARFEVSYRNMSARRGDPVNLLCEVFGDQPIQVTWSKNSNRIELGSYR